jgi:integrase
MRTRSKLSNRLGLVALVLVLAAICRWCTMPNAKGRRRRFGAVRRLPSGRYQVRYPGPDGVVRPAEDTFETKTEAEVWLTRKEAEILEGDWIDPDAGAVLLCQYGATWIEERPGLRPKTVTLYRYLLRSHIAPHFPVMAVAALRIGTVRRWRKKLLDNGVSPVTTAKAYRLLRAIMNTAVDDGLIRRNPCRINGAGTEESSERPVLAVHQVYALADAIGPRYRILILLATFASLRWAELAALTPQDIDLAACTARVTRQINYPPGGGYTFGPPKSRAGRRVVPFPDLIVPDLRGHLDRLGQNAALLFTSPDGQPLRHSNFYRRAWMPALTATGLVGTHLHDLRHTGNQFTADAGANPRELMARMGHDSPRAALIYLHSSAERQRDLANKVGKNAKAALRKSGKPKRSGTRMARNQRNAS